MSAQRFRVRFRKGERVRYISHLDVLRYWERAIRRAELPLAYSQGFTPHPKLAFAGPLPLGFTAAAEIVDVTLDERVDIGEFERRLRPETSGDLRLMSVAEVPLSSPPPQSALLWADYTFDLPGLPLDDACARIGDFLARPEFPWTEERREKERTYDLRAAVATLSAQPLDGGVRVSARLQASTDFMARPEQLAAALFPGADAVNYARTALILDEVSPARDLWRRRGRFIE
ncbi:MAG: DUF2344 domain-containing protein [Chloroflexi bacterium]|nr:DUF2344 domain-containing protein [Chloroflexota bacterium]